LVRLKDLKGLDKVTFKFRISIPLWYDWKLWRNSDGWGNRYFNSTLVRLKVVIKQLISVYIKFQFHFGTIESFSSRCVRDIISHISIPLWYDWKQDPIYSDTSYSNFNSTLVRLKAIMIKTTKIFVVIFQFHFGTIESFSIVTALCKISVISIPLWYDWKTRAEWQTLKDYLFQFHFGTIERELSW